jgi:hypothetical protein
VAEGDSITDSISPQPTSYARLYAAATTTTTFNLTALDGAVLQNNSFDPGNSLYDRQTSDIAYVPGGRTSRFQLPIYIYTALIGANDTERNVNSDTAAWTTAVGVLLQNMQAAGFVTVLCTMTAMAGAFSAGRRNTINAIFTGAGWAAANGVDAIIGTDAAGNDTTYYSDGIHPTQVTHNIMQSIYAGVVNQFGITGGVWGVHHM